MSLFSCLVGAFCPRKRLPVPALSVPLFFLLLCGASQCLAFEPPAEEKIHTSFCASEGMLAWYGDPELHGPVSRLRITQYAVRRNALGELVKVDDTRPVYCAEFLLAPDGTLVQDTRMPTGSPDDSQVTKYEINAVLLYDEKSRSTPFRYVAEHDDRGRVIAEHLYRGPELVRTENSYTYDEDGRLRTSQNSLGQVVTYAYDAAGRVLREDWAPANAPGQPFSSRVSTYDSRGRLIAFCETNRSTRFPERNTTFEKRWVYDDWGRLVRVQRFILHPRVELLGEEVHEYDPSSGRVLGRTLRGETGTVQNRYVYDRNGNVVEIARNVQELSGWNFNEHIRFTLDERGNWLRAVMESGKRACIIERVIEYH